jgi:2-haloalkanoic acid dehalogenase type II
MAPSYDVITFDCYGTLIDWDQGILRAFAHAAAHEGAPIDPAWALEAYHAIEPAVQSEGFSSYRRVLAEAARRAAHQIGWSMRNETAEVFAASLPTWPPFADTNAALKRLQAAGYQLAILSNVDNDLLAGTLHHLHIPFRFVVTAEQVGSYKPAHGHFREARRRLEGLRWLHAAQSYFHDIVPCGELGIPSVWVNRKHEQPLSGGSPLATVPDMKGLADWLDA